MRIELESFAQNMLNDFEGLEPGWMPDRGLECNELFWWLFAEVQEGNYRKAKKIFKVLRRMGARCAKMHAWDYAQWLVLSKESHLHILVYGCKE